MFESKEDLKEKIQKLESELAALKKVNICLQNDNEKTTKDCDYLRKFAENAEKNAMTYHEYATKYASENKAFKETNTIYKELIEAQEKKIRALENHTITSGGIQ